MNGHWIVPHMNAPRRLTNRHMGRLGRNVIALLTGLALALASWSAADAQSTAPGLRSGIKIVALGDSLSAGYQLPADQAFPAQLQAALTKRGRQVEVVNAGVSGDTASGGLARLDWAVPPDAAGVILELGANDALRGVDPAQTRKALAGIIATLKGRGVEILLAGMQAPRNLGEDYRARFDAIFPDLAKANGLILYPFFMEGVVLDPKLTLDDRMHPTAEGVGIIVQGILPDVERLVAAIEAKRKS